MRLSETFVGTRSIPLSPRLVNGTRLSSNTPCKCFPRRIEPRHTPTRVAFFATPAGGRVRSVAGGRVYSAAVTVDGRVFKWGLNRPGRPSHGNEHRMDSRGDDLGEADEGAAVQVSVPHQVSGNSMEVSKLHRGAGLSPHMHPTRVTFNRPGEQRKKSTKTGCSCR